MTTADLTVHHEIAALVHRLAACLDEGRFDDLRPLLADDATADTPGGRAEGVEAVVAQARRNHGDQPVQHVVADVLVDLAAADRAAVRANVLLTFADPVSRRPTRTLGGVYRFTARATAAGWRLDSVATEPVWSTGEPLPGGAAR